MGVALKPFQKVTWYVSVYLEMEAKFAKTAQPNITFVIHKPLLT